MTLKQDNRNVDVKQAVLAAKTALEGFYGTEDIADVHLEEVELAEDETAWLITLGFARKSGELSPLAASIFGSDYGPSERVYKLFKIDAQTGECLSMKIRAV